MHAAEANTLCVVDNEPIVFVGLGSRGPRMTKLVERVRLNPYPVPMKTLAEELECNPSTVKRIVACLVKEYGLPIVSSRAGYAWRPPRVTAQRKPQP
jgi:hypothetical protein